MTVIEPVATVPAGPALAAPRPVRRLVALGDSTTVGLGDPLPDGGWRGYARLLRDALGGPDRVELTVLARTGARAAETREVQAPAAAALAPDVAIVCVGMNDTLRSDFDADGIGRDCAHAVAALRAAGAHVLLLRFHDHTRVFRLPGPLGRVLRARIGALNAALDAVVAAAPGVGVLDLDAIPGVYAPSSWSVDRLHPSERGHRLLARGFGDLLAAAGWDVAAPVAPGCSGGRPMTSADHAAWLVGQGVPWLGRRARDLGPALVRAAAGGLVGGLVGAVAGGRVDGPRTA